MRRTDSLHDRALGVMLVSWAIREMTLKAIDSARENDPKTRNSLPMTGDRSAYAMFVRGTGNEMGGISRG